MGVCGSLMQDMVQIPEENTYFVTRLLLKTFGNNYFGSLGVESPHGRAIKNNAVTFAKGFAKDFAVGL